MTDFIEAQMIGPRRRTIWQDRFARERLASAQMRRRIRKPSKAHSTNRERSQADREKARAVALKIARRAEQYQAYRQAVREYWAGERDSHPAHPEGE